MDFKVMFQLWENWVNSAKGKQCFIAGVRNMHPSFPFHASVACMTCSLIQHVKNPSCLHQISIAHYVRDIFRTSKFVHIFWDILHVMPSKHKLFDHACICAVHHKETYLLYAFFWVIPRRLTFICRRFGTLRLFRIYRRVGTKND
jgi:hypothetical protein